MCSPTMKEALEALALSKDRAGNAARAALLRKWGVRIPRLHGDVVVTIARTALARAKAEQ